MMLTENLFGSKNQKYHLGQIWSYKTRLGEEKSRLYICKIEDLPGNVKAFHIYIDGLCIKNPYTESGVQICLTHAPVDAETLESSVIELLGQASHMPDISKGYNAWKEAFDAGEGGIFKIEVAKIIQYIEEIVSASKPVEE